MTSLKERAGFAIALAASGWAFARLIRSTRAIDFAGKVVVIFGGSRGLGLVLARLLVDDGARVVLVARDGQELERASVDLAARGGSVTALTCDIRNQAEVEAAIQTIALEQGVIDVLINDAGIIQVGPVEHATLADFEDAMQTHFWGPLYSMAAALPHMRASEAKRIVNISSIGGQVAVPHLLPYSASKFALTGLSEGLAAELARYGVRITTVCPGLMRTGSTYQAIFKGRHRQEFAWFHVSDSLPGLSIDAVSAAEQIIDACRHGDSTLTITLPARAAVALKALFPHAWAAAMSLANRMLPSPTSSIGNQTRSGFESTSWAAPSALTSLADRATVENNELPAGAPVLPSATGRRL